ncbi:hypothetical protein ACJJIW_19570 [Microbulbifer sp. JMSA004]|uniref:hypothetical protein n=1 Tax=unclassified Microbulbifer TaxID=2619833 RepID=UPI00403A8001
MRFFSIFFIFFSAGVYADFPDEQGEINFLQVHKTPESDSSSGNRFIVKLDGGMSEDTCGGGQWTGYLTSEAGAAQYSMLLSSVMAGKEVKIEGNSNVICEGTSTLIRNVYLVF